MMSATLGMIDQLEGSMECAWVTYVLAAVMFESCALRPICRSLLWASEWNGVLACKFSELTLELMDTYS